MRIFSFESDLGVLLVFIIMYPWGQLQAQESAGRHEGPKVLYTENFNSYKAGELPPGWWVEGGEAVYVKDGHLLVKADPQAKRAPGYAATVWNRKQFSGNVRVEFDAQVVKSTIGANNINFFLYYTHPGANSTIYGTRNLRLNGMYSHYHDLNGYIFTFVNTHRTGKDEARFRMRRCPGFELIDENYAYQNHEGKTYRITITKRKNELTYAVDGTVYLHATDAKYNWRKGLIGFRTFHSVVWFDNLEITRL